MNFFKQFLLHPVQMGAVKASSPALAKEIVQLTRLKEKRVVVELGPGTGAITQEIVSSLSEKTTFFAVEINSALVQQFQKRFPDQTIYRADARELPLRLADQGIQSVDCIISGLPWAGFDHTLQKELLNVIYHALEPGGVFATYGYIHGPHLPAGKAFRTLLDETFSTVEKSRVVWMNLPPAFVYLCKK